MVRNYLKKRPVPSWTEEDMTKALEMINRNEISARKASERFGIPKSCILRRKNNHLMPKTPRNDHFKQVFTQQQETELVEHILDLERRFYGITPLDARRFAFELAEKMQLNHPFNKTAKLAGNDWLSGFKKRNPQLSIRAPEPTSIARAAGFNKPQVRKFFDVVRSVLETYNLHPGQIYNIDETGVNSVPVPRKILAEKGKKQVGRIVSTERGFNVTAVCGISAAGSYIPPFFLFPRQRMNPLFMKGCSPGAVGYANGSGWMDSDHFVKYLDHFIHHVKPGPNNKILLILDNHNSHRTLTAINKARENNIIMVSLPPHTSHRLQPLDCTVFGSLKHQYAKECDLWHTNNPGSRVSLYDIVEMFSKAFLHIATMEKAVKGFQTTGIYPFNDEIFSDECFLPAEVTDVPVEEETERSMPAENFPDDHQPETENVFKEPQPSCSYTSFKDVILKVSPKPRSVSRKNKNQNSQQRASRAQHAEELTSSPFKDQLIAKEAKKQQDTKSVKRKLTENADGKLIIRKKKTVEKKVVEVSNSDSEDEDTNTICIYCPSRYGESRAGEGWIQCQDCRGWAHDACAGVSESDDEFICLKCL